MRTYRKTRRRRRPRTTEATRPVDVVSQLETAFKDPLAAALGGILGGIVPWFGRELAHGEIAAAWYADPKLIVIAGCMLFSMLSVYTFGRATFGNPRKALGFVAALEGVMLVSHGRIGIVALCVLIAINAIANGCTIALARAATIRRREADARRSATRTRRHEAAPTPARRQPSAPHRPSLHGGHDDVPVWQPRIVRDADDSIIDAAEIVNEWRYS